MASTVIDTFESSSGSGTYEVKVDNATNKLWCDCRGWKNKRTGQPYHCKHTDAVVNGSSNGSANYVGWRFEQRWDEHTYAIARPDNVPVRTQPQPGTRSPRVAQPTAALQTGRPPSLEQVREANRKKGYDVVRRTRRNLGE